VFTNAYLPSPELAALGEGRGSWPLAIAS